MIYKGIKFVILFLSVNKADPILIRRPIKSFYDWSFELIL